MTSYLCELAWLGGERPERDVTLEVKDGTITSVTPGAPAPSGAERLHGLTVPGFANAHSHAFQRALRGVAQSGAASFWEWREAMYRLASELDPDSYRELAAATFAEMALAGVTAVGEFHYLHHAPGGRGYAEPNEMSLAVADAAREAGIRITIIDVCYLHGGIGRPPEGAQLRFSDGDVDAWCDRASGFAARDGARVAAAVHSVRAVTPPEAREVAHWAAARGAVLHAHLSEQPAENEACAGAYGMTPAALLADAGAVSERFTAVHATHLAAGDFDLLGRAGATCCMCPTTERDLGDGIGPAARLRDAGTALALGSDSHAMIEPLEEARAVELDERLARGARGSFSAPELLRALTAGGYESIGWPEGGRIEPGAPADLVTFALDRPHLAGTASGDELASLVFAGSAADVDRVIAGGRTIVRDGRHVNLDVPRELVRTIERVRG